MVVSVERRRGERWKLPGFDGSIKIENLRDFDGDFSIVRAVQMLRRLLLVR